VKRNVGIGIGICVAAAITVLVIFTNVDDLVSTNIEEATSQVEFSNPLQTYEIDSKCDLSYLLLDHYTKTNGQSFDMIALHEVVTAEMETKSAQIRQKYFDLETGKGNEQFDNSGRLKSDSPFLIEMFEEIYLKSFMERKNVDPKLESLVYDWIWEASSVGNPKSTVESEAAANYQIIFLTESDYAEDPECGKKHHEDFGDEPYI